MDTAEQKTPKQKKAKKELTKKTKVIVMCSTIVGGLVIGCGTGFLIGYFGKPAAININDVDVADVVDDTSNLLAKYNECKANGEDPVAKFTVAELANVSILKVMALESSYSFGYGTANSVVNMDVRNATIARSGVAFEESISLSQGSGLIKVAQRAYLENDIIASYGATIPDVEHPSWIDEKTEYSTQDFEKMYGKSVDYPFIYVISTKSVLTETNTETKPSGEVIKGNSRVEKSENGYTLTMDLHTVYSIVRYARRMHALSGSDVSYFNYVNMVFETDDDFNLISSHVRESYYATVGSVGATSLGEMITYYYSGEKAIPDLSTGIDYSTGRPS